MAAAAANGKRRCKLDDSLEAPRKAASDGEGRLDERNRLKRAIRQIEVERGKAA